MAKVAIIGASGRMGRMLIAAVDQAGHDLVAAVEYAGNPLLGEDAGSLAGMAANGIQLSSDKRDAIAQADFIIEFTGTASTLETVALCRELATPIVIGTTGFNEDEEAQISAAAEHLPIMKAGNYSVGVTVTLKILEQTAKALGKPFDVEVIEAHHKHKVDAPSGTALNMGQAVARGLGIDLNDHAVFAREGITGERPDGVIGFSTIRGGDIVGEHTVMFAGIGERVEISHRATNRMNFASGAVRAGVWVSAQQNGLYDMQDVLGLKDIS
ncbi:MAG: 4-hydroxy-tetrahydrodipicolinate reductase [Gammaproteobacteria bacterium]|nr:4-hydroxy-tetrahydrodipicolinate reductase [Gammaproteobacteria bacterium]